MPSLAGGFKSGLYHPRDARGVKLGEARADQAGAATFSFTFQTADFQATIVPRGYYEIWLVYPPGNVIAPSVASWQCPPATLLSGKVYDGAGKPVPPGGTVQVKVTTDAGIVIYDRSVPIIEGAYRLDDVPEPATTEVTARVPGWPPRTRGDGIGSLQIKWAGYPKGAVSGDVFTDTQGAPLVYNFGGPATATDPDAPAYFLAPDLTAPEMASAKLSGRVYDQTGRAVPDHVGAKIIVDASPRGGSPAFHAQVDVRDGTYSVEGVPTGVPVSVDLRINPIYPLRAPRQAVLIPLKISGHENVLNFGGPATPDDPEAPDHPFPSPEPVFTGPSPFTPLGPERLQRMSWVAIATSRSTARVSSCRPPVIQGQEAVRPHIDQPVAAFPPRQPERSGEEPGCSPPVEDPIPAHAERRRVRLEVRERVRFGPDDAYQEAGLDFPVRDGRRRPYPAVRKQHRWLQGERQADLLDDLEAEIAQHRLDELVVRLDPRQVAFRQDHLDVGGVEAQDQDAGLVPSPLAIDLDDVGLLVAGGRRLEHAVGETTALPQVGGRARPAQRARHPRGSQGHEVASDQGGKRGEPAKRQDSAQTSHGCPSYWHRFAQLERLLPIMARTGSRCLEGG